MMKIRNCNKADIRNIYDLICELEDKDFDYEKFKTIFDIKLNNNNCLYIVGIEDDTIIAFLSLNIDYQLHHTKKVGTIEELIVNEKYRSKGVGKILLDNAIEYAKTKNCEIVELTSNLTREKAHNFYIKNGFNKSSYKFVMKLI